MDNSDDVFEQQLRQLSGTERVSSLLKEGERLSRLHLSGGPGNTVGAPFLKRAVDRLREARRTVDADDPMRAEIEVKLGGVLSVLYMGGDGTAQDRDEAIELLDATIDKAGLTPVARQMALIQLARISMRRPFETGTGDRVATVEWVALRLHTVPLEAAMADVDRAERCLRALTEANPMNTSIQQFAGELRTHVELMRDMFTGVDERDVESTSRHVRTLIERMLAADQSGTIVGSDFPQWTEATPSPVPEPSTSFDERENDETRQALREHLSAFTNGEATSDNAPAQLAAALLRPDAAPVDEAAADEAVALATAVVEQGCADPVRHATDRFLLGVTLWVRSRAGDGDGWGEGHTASSRTDLHSGAEEVVAAARGLPTGHPLEIPALVSLPAFLDGFRPLRGVLDSVAEPFVERAAKALPNAGAEQQQQLRALIEICRAAVAARCGQQPDLTALQARLAAAPRDVAWRHRLMGALAAAQLSTTAAGDTVPDDAAVRRGRIAADAALASAPQSASDGGPRALAALAELADAVVRKDSARLALLAATLATGADPLPGLGPDIQVRLREFGRQAVSAALTGQIGAPAGRTNAVSDPGDTDTGARRRLLTGITDLLAGRTTEESQPPVVATPPVDPKTDEATDVLIAAVGRLGTPSLAEELRRTGTGTLIHLLPIDGDTVMTLTLDVASGTTTATGPVPVPGPFDPSAPGGWCDQARPVLGRSLDGANRRGQVAVVAGGDLSELPWHAVRERVPNDGYRYADDRAAFTVHRSVAGVMRRQARAVTEDVVFLANPTGDREAASVEAMVLRRMFHPNSVGLGNTVERVDGSGTAADLLARLPGPQGPGASLLHLGCAVRSASPPALGLADGWLDLCHVAQQATARPADVPSGLVILPADAADGSTTVADALLESGFAAVVGWLWPVDAAVAALMVYRLHAFLADDGLAAADAVRAVYTWMRDPDRDPLPGNPYPYTEAAHRNDLTAERHWAALHLRGR